MIKEGETATADANEAPVWTTGGKGIRMGP